MRTAEKSAVKARSILSSTGGGSAASMGLPPASADPTGAAIDEPGGSESRVGAEARSRRAKVFIEGGFLHEAGLASSPRCAAPAARRLRPGGTLTRPDDKQPRRRCAPRGSRGTS
jgi:hypothetical protein